MCAVRGGDVCGGRPVSRPGVFRIPGPVCLPEGFAYFFSRRPKGPLDVSSPGNESFSLNGRMTGLFALHCRIQTEGMSEGRSLQRRAFRRSSIEVRRAGRNLESTRRCPSIAISTTTREATIHRHIWLLAIDQIRRRWGATGKTGPL